MPLVAALTLRNGMELCDMLVFSQKLIFLNNYIIKHYYYYFHCFTDSLFSLLDCRQFIIFIYTQEEIDYVDHNQSISAT